MAQLLWGGRIMGYKILDVKEDIKEDLIRWMRSKSPAGDVSVECDELCQIVDEHFEKIER